MAPKGRRKNLIVARTTNDLGLLEKRPKVVIVSYQDCGLLNEVVNQNIAIYCNDIYLHFVLFTSIPEQELGIRKWKDSSLVATTNNVQKLFSSLGAMTPWHPCSIITYVPSLDISAKIPNVSKSEIKCKKQKWIQIQSKYMFRQNFKYISAKCNLFFFHRRLKKEETEAVTKKPTKESTAKVENDEEASGSSWWDMGYSSLLNKA